MNLSVRFWLKHPSCARNVGNYKVSTTLNVERTVETEFRNLVESKTAFTGSKNEWTNLRERILESHKFINKVNIDATILGLCNKYGGLEVGRTYIQYLNDQKHNLNVAVLGKYLRLFAIPEGEKCLPEDQENEILGLYNSIRASQSTLPANAAESFVYALCLTPYWEEAVELFTTIKLFSIPSHAAYGSLISAAFRYGNERMGRKWLEEALASNRFPTAQSLIAWVDFCARNKTGFDVFLEFIGQHELLITEPISKRLKQYLEEDGVSVQLTDITKKGSCNNCGTNLEEISLTNIEFTVLKEEFLKRVLIKDNIFLKSSPQELEDFNQLLSKTGPYDCIIDGLNVAYSLGNHKLPNALANQVFD